MASVRKEIERAVTNSDDGSICAKHAYIMSALGLSGCNHRKFNSALTALNKSGKFKVTKTSTHTTITAL